MIEDLGDTLGKAFCKFKNIQDNDEIITIAQWFKQELRQYLQTSFTNEDQKPIFSLSEDQEISLIGVIDDLLSSAKNIQTMISEEKDLKAKIEKLKAQIQGCTLDEKDLNKNKNLEFQIRDTQMAIAREKQNIEHKQAQREGSVGDLDKKERELSEIEDSKSHREHEISILNYAKKYIKLLDEYIDIVRRQRLNELQRHTTDLYNQLQPIEEFRGTIKFDDQDYSTQIIRSDKKILPKKDLSDGGKEL